MIWLGGFIVMASFAGKRGVGFYKAVLNKTAFQNGPMVIGRYH